MEGIVAQVKKLAQVDGAAHNAILQSLRELYISLETRQDTMQRISYAVCYYCSLATSQHALSLTSALSEISSIVHFYV